MSDTLHLQQRRLLYSGRVQGVGFRYTTRSIASGYDAVGFVRNLPDGRVELVIEGQPDTLDALLAAVKDRLGGHIREVTCDTTPPTGEFTRFEIRH